MNDFGSVIKRLRKEKHVTQRELAEKANVDFTYISKIENGKLENYPSAETIIKIANVLNADSDELILLAKKIPDSIRETIIEDDLANTFLRKIPHLTEEQRKKFKDFIDEV